MYNNAILINPELVNAYILIGNIYSAEQKYEEAVEFYKKALELEPADANIYTLLGNTYVMLQDLRSAISCYKQAIDIETDNDEIKLIYIEIVQEFVNNKVNDNAA